MKVCVLGTRGFPQIQGGVEKHCELLYTAVQNEDVKFIVFRRTPYVNQTPTYYNIEFIDLPSTKIKGFEALFHSLIATIYALFIRPDIVHIHNMGPSMFAPILRLFGIKVVMTYHSANYEHKKWGYWAKKLLHFSEQVAFRASNKIIYVNKFQLNKAPSRFQHKCVYIPNGVTKVERTENTDYLSELNILPQKYVLAVGRITPEKGFDILIRAFANIKTDVKLVIAGGVETENTYLKELKGLIAPERIVFTGYVFGEKLQQLYSHAAFYVLSSRNEGFPLVLLEAMSYHLNVLVSDISAAHLVSLHEEDYYVTEDVNQLSLRIEQKLQESSYREYDLQNFNWDIIANKTIHLFKSL